MDQSQFLSQLEKERNKHLSILEGCVDAVVTINQHGIIEFFNTAAENLFEYTREEVLHKNVNMLMPFEHSVNHDEYLHRYIQTKVAHVIGIGREVEILTKSGKKKPILLTLSQAVVDNEYIFTAFIKDYTEKKIIEAELKKLSLVASQTNNGVIITNRDRLIEWINESFLRISGYSQDELIGKKPGKLLQGKETDPETIRRIRQKLDLGQPFSEEILNYHKNGKPYWVKLHISPILNKEGEIEKFIAIEYDTTQEHRMREEIQLANDRIHSWNMHYRAILEAIPDLMFRFDQHGNYLDYHSKPEAEKDMVAPPEELLGSNIYEHLPKRSADLLQKNINKALQSGSIQVFEDELEMPNGLQNYECRIAPVSGRNEVLAMIRNISDRKKDEMEIKNSEARLNETQRIARLGTWEIDLENSTAFWSRETFHLFGLAPQKTTPAEKIFLKIIHPEDRKIFKTGLNRIVTEKIENSIEFRNVLQDGNTIHIQAHGVPIFKNGKLIKILGTLLDITKRKQYEEELETAKRKAEESTKAKELFLANTSHEIRTPMNAIVGVSQLLRKTELDAQQIEYLTIIEKSAGNLLTIINDILDLSKIESNNLKIENTSFNLKEVIESVINMTQFLAKEKNLNLRYICPSPNEDTTLIGDPLRLEQVLLNLVNNAIKFTHTGSVEINLELKEETANSYKIGFEVIDTGIGISAEKLEVIFNDFTQADASTTRIYGGTGLGLSISRKLVQLMGGELKVSSQPGKGTNFFFTLEFSKGEQKTIADAPQSKSSTQLNNLDGIQILLVEDQEFNQFVAKRLLELLKARVEIASNGKIAIEKLEQNSFDVILMDIQMPVMDGIEATHYIRKRMSKPKCDIPIIALTAHALKDDEQKYYSHGMNGYLSKPFKSEILAEVIRKTIEKNKVPQEIPTSEEHESQTNHKEYNLVMFEEMAGNDNTFLKGLISSFLTSTAKGIKELNDLSDSFDFKKTKITAHTIKPGFKMLERNDIFDLLVQIEHLAENEQQHNEIPDKLDQINQLYIKLKPALEEKLNELN